MGVPERHVCTHSDDLERHSRPPPAQCATYLIVLSATMGSAVCRLYARLHAVRARQALYKYHLGVQSHCRPAPDAL